MVEHRRDDSLAGCVLVEMIMDGRDMEMME